MDDSGTGELISSAVAGDAMAFERLLSLHRGRLHRMVSLRLDRRLRSRVDPSDVIQEASVDALRRLKEYAARPDLPFYLWLRYLTVQRLLDQVRRHLGTRSRDVSREIRLHDGPLPEATTAALAAQLMGRLTDPCEAAIRAERRLRLQEALDQMDPLDREVLALRHFEQLSNREVAQLLGLDKSAASKRYARALMRLKGIVHSPEIAGDGLP